MFLNLLKCVSNNFQFFFTMSGKKWEKIVCKNHGTLFDFWKKMETQKDSHLLQFADPFLGGAHLIGLSTNKIILRLILIGKN